MKTIQIFLPNSPDNFLLVEMCERLKEGQTVIMQFGGVSMLPLINGCGEKIKLRPLLSDENCVVGEVYLFFYQNHYIIHRLMKIKGDTYIFRGDNCYNCEYVQREDVLAKLIEIIQPNGNVVDCESEDWRAVSRKVVRRRTIRNTISRLLSPKHRKCLSILYFIVLAVLMWAPINGLSIALNNYIFGLRVDHILHASVYLLVPLFLTPWLRRRTTLILCVSVLIGLVTESVQLLLPYRGFDINDLVANAIGAIFGWLFILFLLRFRKK